MYYRCPNCGNLFDNINTVNGYCYVCDDHHRLDTLPNMLETGQRVIVNEAINNRCTFPFFHQKEYEFLGQEGVVCRTGYNARGAGEHLLFVRFEDGEERAFFENELTVISSLKNS